MWTFRPFSLAVLTAAWVSLGGPTACVEPEGVAPTPRGDVSELQHERVWIFLRDDENHGNALQGGAAEIKDDCLLVDDSVVVWDDGHLDDVREIIAAVASGDSVTVTIGGGAQVELEEGDSPQDIPRAIAQRCGERDVWGASPDPIEWQVD